MIQESMKIATFRTEDPKVKSVINFSKKHHFRNCLFIPKPETVGCKAACESKWQAVEQWVGYCIPEMEIKTLVFKYRKEKGMGMIACHLPCTMKLPAIGERRFDYSRIMKAIGIDTNYFFWHNEMKAGTLNPISLSLQHKDVIHFFHAYYRQRSAPTYVTTNAGNNVSAIVFRLEDLWRSFEIEKIKINEFNF